MAISTSSTSASNTNPEKVRTRSNGAKKNTDTFPSGKGINLILENTEQLQQGAERSIVSHLIASVFVGVILVAVVYGALFIFSYFKEQELASLKQERQRVENSISTIEAHRTELVQFQNTLENIKKLLTTHMRWTNFFAAVEKETVQDVTYISVIMSPDGRIRLSGVARDYATLARQLRAFEEANDVFTNVSIPSGHAVLGPSGETIGVNFDAALTLRSDVLTTMTR